MRPSRTSQSTILRSVISAPSFVVAADQLGDEARRGRDRADHGRLGAVGRVALEPRRELVAALELEAPERRVAVEEHVLGEDVADVRGAEHVGEAFAQVLRGRVVEDRGFESVMGPSCRSSSTRRYEPAATAHRPNADLARRPHPQN